MKLTAARPNAPTVVVIGESLIDIVTGQSGKHSIHPGGSPLNVAVGLARLEVPTELATRIGDDPNGEVINSHLADAGVTLQSGSRGAVRTSTSHASIGADGSATYDFDIGWDLREVHVEAPLAVHTGSLATILEPGASRIDEALRRLPEKTLISFDPNIRPSLAPPRETTRARVENFASLAHIVKMSEEDAAWLYPGTEPGALAERFASLGVLLFVLTRAERGCVIASNNTLRRLPAEPATVVDTVGAGDAFMSGLIYEAIRSGAANQLTGKAVEAELIDACAQTALRSAAITVSRAGANPPNRRDLAR
ncbi:carbohydrate kinase [Brachybacterium sp. GCM10030252]|uniref:carbohydrate kinase family protein n=1 Tax=Brachybacterium sp. GCM10030252 TaxID=3273380 RepID=UPI00362039F9